MAAGEHPFIDITVRDEVRERFAAGDALLMIDSELQTVLWANGPGAALFAGTDVGALIGAAAPLGIAPRRQISALYGFPKVGRDRAVTIRLGASALNVLVSAVDLPGETGILIVAPAPRRAGAGPVADKAIAGLEEPGQYLALVGGDGSLHAASDGFARLNISGETLRDLAEQVSHVADRLVKRLVRTTEGRTVAAGMGRLTDDPALSLLIVVDEMAVSAADDGAEFAQEEPGGQGGPEPDLATGAIEPQEHATDDHRLTDEAASRPTTSGFVRLPADDLSVGAEDDASDGDLPGAASIGRTGAPELSETGQGAEPEPENVVPRAAGPVRFVWRTDSEGRISELGGDLAAAVGVEASDVVGRHFVELCRDFGMDPAGEIAALLERRDTWSGRSLLWPVAGTDLRVPVDLAALPVYDRARNFQGFRGFGVARAADAVVDPDARGLNLDGLQGAAAEAKSEAPTETIETVSNDVVTTERGVNGSHGAPDDPAGPAREQPTLRLVPKTAAPPPPPQRVLNIAAQRTPANDRGLTPGEENAFREIGDRLKREGGLAPGSPSGRDTDKVKESAGRDELDDARPTQPDTETDQLPLADLGHTMRAPEPGLAEIIEADTAGNGMADEQVTGQDTRAQSEDELEATRDWTEEPSASGDETPATSEVIEEADFAEGPASVTAEAVGPGTAGQDSEPSEYLDEFRDAAEDQTGAATGSAALAQASESTDGSPSDRFDADEDAFAPSSAAWEGRRERPPIDTSILDKLPVPVLIHSGDALHYANPEFLEFTAYSDIEELRVAGGIGVLFEEPYPAEEYGGERKLRLRRADGLDVPVEAFLQSAPWNGGMALLLSLRRVGRAPLPAPHVAPIPVQLSQNEKADLEERLAELRTIIDTATDGVILIAEDATIRSISRPAEALFGLDSDVVAGKPFTSLFAVESQRAARDYLNGLADNGVASVLNDGREVIGREAEGRFIPLFMTIGRLPNRNGYCAVVRDITQWKRAEEDLTQARAQAERASSQKTEFLARVSHEIRTPLNAIIGFSELMMDEKFGPIGNDRYRDYLRDINKSGNHVLDLVNDLLDISKIEAGQQELSYEAVPLNDMLAESVAMMQPQANRERVIIRSSFASSLPDVVADPRTIRQIALNLLSNAIRYTQAGGQVIVSTAYETSGDVVMRFRDTGIGMSPTEIEQALKPFKQINAIKRPRGDGTGLGLPLTKAMVEANRARFQILSTPGEGTLVEITFPSTRVLAD